MNRLLALAIALTPTLVLGQAKPPYIPTTAYQVNALTGSDGPASGVETLYGASSLTWRCHGSTCTNPLGGGCAASCDPGIEGLRAVIGSWSGGFKAIGGTKMYPFGGGHGASANNGVYVFDFADDGTGRPIGWSVLSVSDPSAVVECTNLYTDGRSTSVHNYDGTILSNNKLYRIGGAYYCGAGGSTKASAKFDLGTNTWSAITTWPGSHASDNIFGSLYDPVSGKFLTAPMGSVDGRVYDPSTESWSSAKTVWWPSSGQGGCGAFDTSRNRGILFWGATGPRLVNWNPTTGAVSDGGQITLTGAGASVVAENGHSCVYDPSRDVYWVWGGCVDVPGGCSTSAGWTNIYEVQPTAPFAVTTHPLSGDAISLAAQWGSYGRFVYMDEWDAIGLLADWNSPVYVVALPGIPDCQDGLDNDGDGYIDLADIGCTDANDTTEEGISSAPTAIATVTLKETSAVVATQWPTRVVVPLPQTGGGFPLTATTNLRVYGNNEADNVGRCDEVLERDWKSSANPKPIRHVACDFRGTVTASGESTYYIHNSGGDVGYGPTSPATMVTGTGPYTVSTGAVRFTISTTAFNIFDTVSLDLSDPRDGIYETSVITSSSNNGGRMQACDTPSGGTCSNIAQHDSSLAPDLVTLEEDNQMRAVLRLERYTRYNGINDMQHGYVVRIYAYAGSPMVKVDYQLVNAATGDTYAGSYNTLRGTPGRWADPFYFDSLTLDFALEGGITTVKTGVSGNGVNSQSVGSGIEFRYTRHDNYTLSGASSCTDAVNDSTNDCDTAGFMDASNANLGVQVAMRNMWELWPSGFEATSGGVVQAQLFPDWGGNWFNAAQHSTYWLDDMQAVVKEVLFNFHGSVPSDDTLTAIARTFDRYPVPTLPASYYRSTGVTLDLGGKVPATVTPDASALLETNSGSDMNEASLIGNSSDTYRMSFRYWYPDDRARLWDSEGGGEGPISGEEFAISASPADLWQLERWMWGDLNARPIWMGRDYSYADDWATLQLDQQPYGNGSPAEVHWRDDGDPNGDGGSYPFAGDGRYAEGRDGQHSWFYHIADYYWLSGNLWAKDWLTWMGEFSRRTFLGGQDPDAYFSTRAFGHQHWRQWQSYRVTGITAYLDEMVDWLVADEYANIDPLCGQHNTRDWDLAALEAAFWMRGIGSTLPDLKGNDWMRWAQSFLFMSAQAEWFQFYGHYKYPPIQAACLVGGSSPTCHSCTDPMAYYYWITGKSRIKALDQQYADSGVTSAGAPGGSRPYVSATPGGRLFVVDTGTSGYGDNTWDGRYDGRLHFFVRTESRPDSDPPAAVSDLSVSLAGTTLTAEWTRPTYVGSTPSYYLIVWSDRNIVECTSNCATDPDATDTTNNRNWWAATPAAVADSTACSGGSCSAAVAGVTASPVYAAVFSFDAADNMSSMSNVAVSGCGDGSVDPGATPPEECDEGSLLNGTPDSCCDATCQYKDAGTACTYDANPCTTDTCDGAGTCNAVNNTDPCDDGQYCTQTDTCSGGLCVGAGNPCAGHNTGPDCDDSCDDDSDTCTGNDADGTSCDDGLFCYNAILRDGTDTCSSGACTGGTSGATCDDSDICTDDSCNDVTDACVNTLDTSNDPSCLQGSQCSGQFSLGPAPP